MLQAHHSNIQICLSIKMYIINVENSRGASYFCGDINILLI